MINGNISGIKDIYLEELETLYEIKSETLCNPVILETAARLSSKFNREINLVISRSGVLTDIIIGTQSKVNAPVTSHQGKSLSRLRTIHTHPNGNYDFSELDISALKNSMYDCMAVAGVLDGKIMGAKAAYYDGEKVEFLSGDLQDAEFLQKITETDKRIKAAAGKTVETSKSKERAILAGLSLGEKNFDYSMQELSELALTAGAAIVGTVVQHKGKAETATLIGTGKVDELRAAVQNTGSNLVIFDNELSGIQVKNLEDRLNVKVIDRPTLILDIFAGRATSSEGKLQVSLAQLKYNLPRLIGVGGQLAKMRSGIGMRGPGETKLETDRRVIRGKVLEIERKIAELSKERDLRRSKRAVNKCFTIALVGYTNTGKSTLMNLLSGSSLLAEDKLFATLDPIVRNVKIYNSEFLLIDTVGFVNKLPHQFIDAFASTLEEAKYADLLLHVMDAGSPYLNIQYDVVMDVLNKIGAGGKPIINIYNKIDKLKNANEHPELPVVENTVQISALKNENIGKLKDMIISFVEKYKK